MLAESKDVATQCTACASLAILAPLASKTVAGAKDWAGLNLPANCLGTRTLMGKLMRTTVCFARTNPRITWG